jgi:Squalene-hopene cyclase C-terminal domain/Prenyltransferase and squalene oxidase repeat
MGLKLAVAAVALALAASPSGFVASHQQSDGGFSETGQSSDANLTAWAVLGLSAAGKTPDRSPADYLSQVPATSANDLALRILALRALNRETGALVDRLEGMRGPNGRIGTLVNSTIWGVLALRAAGRPAGTSVLYLKKAQRPNGGWSWYPQGAPDSNDTAAAIQALRTAGVGPRAGALKRGLAYLRRLQRADGGFALAPGRASDAQSTAWAIQAFVAANRQPGRRAFLYLASLRRPDGSYRYSKRYAVTPVWVTSQVLPALARKPFPLKGLAGRCSSPGCDGRSEAADAGSPGSHHYRGD